MKQIYYFILSLLLFTACGNQDLPVSKDTKKPIKCLILGNSITVHDTCDYWWGTWGMAASKRENDFIHQLESKLKKSDRNYICYGINIANWETELNLNVLDLNSLNYVGFGFSQKIDAKDFKIIVIRLGENIKNGIEPEVCEKAFTELIEGIKSVNPSAKLFITGVFWPTYFKEEIIKKIAKSENIPYINIDKFYSPENIQAIGNSVYGNDGSIHYIEHDGVASHPNDAGMKAIAEEIYNTICLDL